MKRFWMAVGAVLAMAAATANLSDARPSQSRASVTLTVGSVPVPNLDYYRSFLGAPVLRLALESLMEVGADGRVHPDLALSVRHPNALTYIYTLRRGVDFWDGHELTAADAAYSLNYYRKAGSQAAYVFGSSVKSIRAAGRYTLVVDLTQPDAAWPFVPAVAGTGIVEAAYAKAHAGQLGRPGVLTMGTGPWKIDSFDPTTGVELSANQHYWAAAPRIQNVSFKFFSDETSEALAFRTGEIDLALQLTDPRAFATTSGSKLITAPAADTGIIAFNVKAAPWNDVHVRRAVAYALNRSALIKASGGYAAPNFTLIPSTLLRALGSKTEIAALLNTVPTYQFDIAKAKQQMAASAYPHGFTASLPTLNQGIYPAVTEAIAGELQRIGIRIRVKLLTSGAFYGALTTPKQRPTHFDIADCVSPDPGECYDYLLGSKNAAQGSFNLANYTPASVDSLIRSGFENAAPSQRLATYGKLLRRLAADVPYISLWVQDASLAISKKFVWPTFDWNWINRTWGLEVKPR